MNNLTTYIGTHKRWIEIGPINIPNIPADRIWDGLSCEFIIYSNEKRNRIGELQPEYNQDNSILGTFSYLFGITLLNLKARSRYQKVKCPI